MHLIFPLRLLQLFGLFTKTASSQPDDLEGEIVDVVRPAQEWRIKFRASYWTARSKTSDDFQPGERVRVIGHKTVGDRTSSTLLIERIKPL
jgi:membrane protein implicated in regulation of membrane protease activity